MVRLAATLAVLLAASAAAPQIGPVTVNRTVRQGGVQATLQRIAVLGTADGTNVVAIFRVTDASDRPLAVVRMARMTLAEAKVSSDPILGSADAGDGTTITLTISRRLRPAAARGVHTVVLDLQAAGLPPTHVWSGVPVQAARGAARAAPPVWHGRTQIVLAGVFRTVSTSLLGNQVRSVVTAEVTERGPRTGAGGGLVRLEGPGLAPSSASRTRAGNGWATYEVSARSVGAAPLPPRVTVRFYSGEAVARSLRPVRFTFTGIRL